MSSAMITLLAPAKINLYLHIVDRRADGYHDLVTRMQKLDLCDCLKLQLRDEPGISFSCDDAQLPQDDSNLAARAAKMLLVSLDKADSTGVQIELEKKIPTAAGLGGGSSDAACVLKGLNGLLGSPCSEAELHELALEIGADVPFFVSEAESVIATGIGEKLRSVPPLQGYLVVLVNPGICVSTQWAFENFALTKKDINFKLKGLRDTIVEGFSLAQMHNDLEQVTISRYPVVGTIKNMLLESGAAAAMMSGSGSTVYGLFDVQHYSENQLNGLVQHYKSVYGERVYVTRPCAGA